MYYNAGVMRSLKSWHWLLKCKEMPVIQVDRAVKKKRKKWRAEEEERHKGSHTPKTCFQVPAWMHMTSWMRTTRANRKWMEAKAAWYEKLMRLHSLPSNRICDVMNFKIFSPKNQRKNWRS
jgi:hypothetical protein